MFFCYPIRGCPQKVKSNFHNLERKMGNRGRIFMALYLTRHKSTARPFLLCLVVIAIDNVIVAKDAKQTADKAHDDNLLHHPTVLEWQEKSFRVKHKVTFHAVD
jgi:hypothetical protein